MIVCSEPPIDSTIVAAEDPTTTWQRLVDGGLDEVLLDALGSLRGLPACEAEDRLVDAGVAALEVDVPGGSQTSLFSGVVQQAIKGRKTAAWEVVRASRQMGGQTSLGVPSSLEDVIAGPVALLRVSDVDAQVSIILDEDWRQRRRDQREALLDLLLELDDVIDVCLVTGAVGQQFLVRRHGGRLPECVVDECRARTGRRPGDDAVQAALDDLDLARDGIDRAIIDRVAEEDTETVTYGALSSLPIERSTLRDHVATGKSSLCGHDVLSRTDRFGDAAVTSGPLFDTLREALEARDARQRRLDDYRGSDGQGGKDAAPGDPSVGDPPKFTPHSRDPEQARERGEEGAATEAAESSRARRSYCHIPGRLDPATHAAVVGASTSADVSLVDRPIDPRSNPCEPTWSFDRDRNEMVVSTEFVGVNPMQCMTSLAMALTAEDFLGDLPAGELRSLSLFRADKDLLRTGRCIGWLPSNIDDALDWLAELRSGREDLRTISAPAASDRSQVSPDVLEELAGEVASDSLAARLQEAAEAETDDSERYRRLRGIVLKQAHGLAGAVASLLDLLDIDLLREIRVPEVSKHLSGDDAKETFSRMVATAIACQSSYGNYSTYRQHFEDREGHREVAPDPPVDPGDPDGDLFGSIVVVGDGVADLQDVLEDALDEGPRPVHPEAPRFRVPVDVDVVDDRPATSLAAVRALDPKDLRLTPEAGALLYGLTGADPYSVAEALAHLAPETRKASRYLRLDELRYALAQLPADRILPSAAPTVSAVLHALLLLKEPISQRQLAERADVTPQSIRNNRDELYDCRLTHVDDDGWRLLLPFQGSDESVESGAVPEILLWEHPSRESFHPDTSVDVHRLVWALHETRPLATSAAVKRNGLDVVAAERMYALRTGIDEFISEADRSKGSWGSIGPENLEAIVGPLCAHHYENWRPDCSPYGGLGSSQRHYLGGSPPPGLGCSQRSGSGGSDQPDGPLQKEIARDSPAMGPPIDWTAPETVAD